MSGLLDTRRHVRPGRRASPSRSRRRPRSAPSVDGLPEREAIEHVVVLGMGGSGIAGDVLAAVAGPVHAGAGHRRQGLRGAGVGGRGHALLRRLLLAATPRRPSRRRQAAAVAGARMVVLSTGGELGRAGRGVGRAARRCCPTCPMPRAGIGSVQHPAARRSSSGSGCSRARRSTSPTPSRQLQRRRDKLIVDGGPAQQLARAIGRTMPDRLRRRRRSAAWPPTASSAR